MSLNYKLCEIIQEQLILGYTIPELAKMWDIKSTTLSNKFFLVKSQKKHIPKVINVEMSGKQRPYYENEDNYGKLPTYIFAELSKKEKEIFLNLNKQQTNETK